MKKVLKNKIIFIIIALIGMMSMMTFCTTEQINWPIMTMTVGQVDEIGGKTVHDFQWPYYDEFFADKDVEEGKEIWNDLYVYTSYAYNYDNVYGIHSIKENDAEGRIEVTFRVFSNDSLGTYVQVNKKAMYIEQEQLEVEEEDEEGEEGEGNTEGENNTEGEGNAGNEVVNEDVPPDEDKPLPKFACIGGEGLRDYDGRTYTAAKGFPFFRIEKETFQELLEKATPEEQETLLLMYETGLPRKVEWFRFQRQFEEELEADGKFEDLDFLRSMYYRDPDDRASYYLRKIRTEEERDRLLDILASCENTWSVLAPSLKEWDQEDYQKPNAFNYRDYYISKFDLISSPVYDAWGYYGIDRDDNKKIQEILFKYELYDPKEFTLYFSKTSKEGDLEFNIEHPFDIRHHCVECFNYKNVWLREIPEEEEEETDEEVVNEDEVINNENEAPNEIPNDPNDPDNNDDDNVDNDNNNNDNNDPEPDPNE